MRWQRLQWQIWICLGAYNAEKGRWIRHKAFPPFRETRNYVAKSSMCAHSACALVAGRLELKC